MNNPLPTRTTNILQRLRFSGIQDYDLDTGVCEAAAQEIERLQAQVLALEAQQTIEFLPEILAELDRITKKSPEWPADPLHAVAIVHEELGKVTQAIRQRTYNQQQASREYVRSTTTKYAATTLRFINHLKHCQCRPSLTKDLKTIH